MLGEAVGSYRVIEKIGEGGMGAIYRAEHVMIGRAVAIKVLLPELSTNRGIVDRFFNEARATSQIRHVGIVEIFDFGYLPDGQAYLVMELLEGAPLTRRMLAFDEQRAALVLRDVCAALTATHAQGIVHRDLKPDNIFMVADAELGERPKLLDFGIAKLSSTFSAAKTRTGAVIGTPIYMSPEQCRGTGLVDHRADLYAIGCIYYEMLTGRTPFVSEGAGNLIGMHLFVEPESPRKHAPHVSAAAERLVMRLLAKDPDKRVQTAAELTELFEQLGDARAAALRLSVESPVRRQTPTTLSGAAYARPVGPAVVLKRSRWPLVAVASLVVAGAGVAAIAMTGHHGRDQVVVPATVQPVVVDAPAPEVDAPAPVFSSPPPPLAIKPAPTTHRPKPPPPPTTKPKPVTPPIETDL